MTTEATQTLSIEAYTPRSRLKHLRTAGDTQRRSRLGIKAKLFIAFFCLAGLTAAASAVAWISTER